MKVTVPPASTARFSNLVRGSLVSIGMSGRIVSGFDKGRFVMDISDVSLFEEDRTWPDD
jgi:hypothetical protein